MEKNKLKNVRLTRSMAKLIGTVVLVDSLIVGVVSLGGHTPIYQDDKNIYKVFETVTKEANGEQEVTISNLYEDEVDKKNRVVYYKKPYYNNGNRVREVVTVYNNTFGPKKEVKTVSVSEDEEDISYVEKYEYDRDLNHFITVKETLYDEVLSDTCLLMILGLIDTAMIAAGNSYIRREEEEKEKEKEL